MRTRFLGGVAACLGAAGLADAQFAPIPADRPAARPAGSAAGPISTTAKLAPPAATPLARPLGATADAAAPTAPAASLPPPSPFPAAPGGNPPTTWPACADGACPPANCRECCEPCGPPGRVWVDAGWVFWAVQGQRLPPLVTAAPAGTPQATAGVLGQPGTTVLYGGGRVNDDWRSGLYVNAGVWLDECQRCGVEGNFFFLDRDTDRFSAGSPGAVIITRPFTNALTGAGDTELVSFPGVLSGGVSVRSRSDVIGGGPNFVKNLCCDPCAGRVDLLLGYQYFNLRDDVTIREDLTGLPGGPTPGTRFQIEDRFRTTNDFHGGTIGVAGERRFGSRWYVGARAAVALGANVMTYDVSGVTVITPPGGAPQSSAGGLLAQPTNIGHFSQTKFAVMPTVGLKLGARLAERVRAYVGYDFLYLSSVARAGDQIDLLVNPNQLPPRTGGLVGPAAPAFTPRTTDFWAQGVRVGVEVRY